MTQKTLLYTLSGVVLVILVVVFFSQAPIPSDSEISTTSSGSQDPVGSLGTAPVLELVDYGGNTISLADFEGKPSVLNSWAVWCPFCKDELPDFAQLQKDFGDDIAVIAIDRAESLEQAKGFTDQIGVIDDMVFLLDSTDSFYRSIGGFSMPETILGLSPNANTAQNRVF